MTRPRTNMVLAHFPPKGTGQTASECITTPNQSFWAIPLVLDKDQQPSSFLPTSETVVSWCEARLGLDLIHLRPRLLSMTNRITAAIRIESTAHVAPKISRLINPSCSINLSVLQLPLGSWLHIPDRSHPKIVLNLIMQMNLANLSWISQMIWILLITWS